MWRLRNRRPRKPSLILLDIAIPRRRHPTPRPTKGVARAALAKIARLPRRPSKKQMRAGQASPPRAGPKPTLPTARPPLESLRVGHLLASREGLTRRIDTPPVPIGRACRRL